MPIGRNSLRPYMMFDRLPGHFVTVHYRAQRRFIGPPPDTPDRVDTLPTRCATSFLTEQEERETGESSKKCDSL
jgi:hypothetical protein